MSVDWRGLLDNARVPWRDRGKNTSRSNINVCCPWCRDDQGFHLGISLEKEAYYCFRRPEHAGHNFVALLVKLGQPRVEAVKLLNTYRGDRAAPREAPEPLPASKAMQAWERFLPAAEAPAIIDYIAARLFDQPEEVARRYDIRCASYGKWAYRMIMPIMLGGELRSWTGRGIRADMVPKYYTMDSHLEGLVYLPRPARRTLIITEGPLDALKLAAAGERLPMAAVALTGKQLNAPRLLNVQQLAEAGMTDRVLLCLDADTSSAEATRMIAELRGNLRLDVQRLKLPAGYKDAGAMPQQFATEWLQGIV